MNVATPLTVVAVVPPVQVSVPPPGLVPMLSWIVAEIPEVITLPPASVMATETFAGNAVPMDVDEGWVMNASLAAGPAVTVNARLVAVVRAGLDVATIW